MKKQVLSAALIVMMVLTLCACGSSGSSGTATKGVLVMATNAEFPPYEYKEGDKIVGIDAEIAEAIAQKIGCKLEIEDIAFDSIIAEVVSGKADIGLAGMTITEDRKQSVNFSDPYATSSQVVIVQEASGIKGLSDLTEDSVIGVQIGTTGDIYCSDSFQNIERYNKGMEAVQALTQGKIDAVVIDSEPAKVFVSENAGLIILDESYTDEEYAAAIRKDNTELLEAVNKALSELKADGTLDAIVAKYISAN
ncbi:MAG: basic amino acid ABC transporter substrate-binding protein [Lachnospiraceae bacterium]|nr:basic amino acid ABC transporter substrate-binding protein [Lachnospiraceae bacterium]